jgi:urease accessory protein
VLNVVEVRQGQGGAATPAPTATALLAHDERHLRRRAIPLTDGRKVLVDLPQPVVLQAGDLLLLEDGSAVRIEAAPEALHDIRGRDPVHLTRLAWHIGNRHLAAEIAADRILILRDHVIAAMLEGLDATVTEVDAPFTPTRGAYDSPGHPAGHGHGHGHEHEHEHGHDHEHDHHHDHDRNDHRQDAGLRRGSSQAPDPDRPPDRGAH